MQSRRDALRKLLRWFFFSSRRRHTRLQGDWSSDVCSSDLDKGVFAAHPVAQPSKQEGTQWANQEAGGKQRDRAQQRRHRVGLVEELDRQDRRQTAEDVEVIPFDDVAHGGGEHYTAEVLWDLPGHSIPLVSSRSVRPHGLNNSGRGTAIRSACVILEFEADPRGGGEGGGVEEAAGWTSEPVVHAGPEGAEVAVEALGEAIVGQEREGVLAAAAAAAAVIGAAGVGAGREAVLLVAVVGGHQVHVRAGGVLHPRPVHLPGLAAVEGAGA